MADSFGEATARTTLAGGDGRDVVPARASVTGYGDAAANVVDAGAGDDADAAVAETERQRREQPP